MSEPDERWQFEGAALSVWRNSPRLGGHDTCAIGAFSCDDAGAGARALSLAQQRLREQGAAAVLGPMNGSTWASYRFVVDSDGRPPFLMEPQNPPHYPEAFERAGFEVVGRYFSAERSTTLPPSTTAPPPGIRLRHLDKAHYEAELGRIYELSLAAFARNAFYTPITRDEFLSSYRPVEDLIDPELVFFAEDEAGNLKGFLFAIPDHAEGASPRTAILKSYASLHKGCGSLLVNAAHEQTRRKGYERVIHALIHSDNLSAMHSGRSGSRIFRRYALWGKLL